VEHILVRVLILTLVIATSVRVAVNASHVFSSNFENSLSSGEEFDVVGDEDIDENDVMEL